MLAKREISVIDSHTAGEPTRVVTGGLPVLEGSTIAERDSSLETELDTLVRVLCGEPRGHAPVHAVLPQPPGDPRADVGLLIISALGSLAMCGHALIGAVTTLVETGALPDRGSPSRYVVETPAGLIDVEADVVDGRVRSVSFENAPSWVLARDVPLALPDADVVLDIVYAGLWYAVLDVEAIGSAITPEQVPRLVATSHAIRGRLNERLAELVADQRRPPHIPQLLYVGPPGGPGSDGRNLATSSELGFDRSPCGTGSSARMALLHARGLLGVRDRFVHESVIGTRFEGTIVREEVQGGRVAVIPRITGSAYITAHTTLVIQPDDPLGEGFLIPPAAG
jgi:proline racemase